MSTLGESAAWPVLPDLVARIESAISAFRTADAFLPIHVLVPNHVLGTLLARALFADTGYLAIHVELPYEFARSLTAPRRKSCCRRSAGAGQSKDLAIVLHAAAAAVAGASTPDYLKRAVEMPGFAPAALRTLRDIAAADVAPASLEALAENAADGDKVQVLAQNRR